MLPHHTTYVLDSHCLARGSLDTFVDDTKTATAKLLKYLVVTGNVVASHLVGLMLVAHRLALSTVWAVWGRSEPGEVELSVWVLGPTAATSKRGCSGPPPGERWLAVQWITPGNILKDDDE